MSDVDSKHIFVCLRELPSELAAGDVSFLDVGKSRRGSKTSNWWINKH